MVQIMNKKQKSSIHPNYREITVVLTDGTKFKTFSTYKSDTLKLEVDAKTHPAWTREANYINTKADEVSKFSKKYAGLDFLKK